LEAYEDVERPRKQELYFEACEDILKDLEKRNCTIGQNIEIYKTDCIQRVGIIQRYRLPRLL
jgi:hypothetical protein